jgi:hypothetical protein
MCAEHCLGYKNGETDVGLDQTASSVKGDCQHTCNLMQAQCHWRAGCAILDRGSQPSLGLGLLSSVRNFYKDIYILLLVLYLMTIFSNSNYVVVSLCHAGAKEERCSSYSFLTSCVQASSEGHPASYPIGTGSPFPGIKGGRGVTTTTHLRSSVEVKNEYELYLLSSWWPHGGSGQLCRLYSVEWRCNTLPIWIIIFNKINLSEI